MHAGTAKHDVRRVTANLPAGLLEKACAVTGKGVTDTLVEGLEMVRRRAAAARLKDLRGKIRLDIDIEASRERPRRCVTSPLRLAGGASPAVRGRRRGVLDPLPRPGGGRIHVRA
jgi:hypothetical protein